MSRLCTGFVPKLCTHCVWQCFWDCFWDCFQTVVEIVHKLFTNPTLFPMCFQIARSFQFHADRIICLLERGKPKPTPHFPPQRFAPALENATASKREAAAEVAAMAGWLVAGTTGCPAPPISWDPDARGAAEADATISPKAASQFAARPQQQNSARACRARIRHPPVSATRPYAPATQGPTPRPGRPSWPSDAASPTTGSPPGLAPSGAPWTAPPAEQRRGLPGLDSLLSSAPSALCSWHVLQGPAPGLAVPRRQAAHHGPLARRRPTKRITARAGSPAGAVYRSTSRATPRPARPGSAPPVSATRP